jgi:hypothetical protein
MKIRTFISQLSHFLLPRIAIIMLIAMACSIPVFCGEIHDAIIQGDLHKVMALLQKNPKVIYSKDRIYGTPLYEAAYYGHTALVELLLAHGADVNVMDN